MPPSFWQGSFMPHSGFTCVNTVLSTVPQWVCGRSRGWQRINLTAWGEATCQKLLPWLRGSGILDSGKSVLISTALACGVLSTPPIPMRQ